MQINNGKPILTIAKSMKRVFDYTTPLTAYLPNEYSGFYKLIAREIRISKKVSTTNIIIEFQNSNPCNLFIEV